MKLKKNIAFSAIIIAVISSNAFASATGCEVKKNEIRTQLDYAKSHNNAQQISGLEKALSEVDDHCTDTALRQERQLKVTKKERKVAERQREFNEAKQTGQQGKIAKKLKKLKEAEDELVEAREQLSQ